MMISWRFQKRDKTAWLVSFFFGFFLGIVMICLFSEALVMQTGFLDPDFLYGIRHLKINQNGLFLYSLRLRLGMAAFLVLLSMAGAAGIGSSLTLVWCGLSAGSVLTVLSLRYGIRGILLFLACVLPQQLLLSHLPHDSRNRRSRSSRR